MLRDRLRDENYFENYIIYQNKRIDKFKEVLKKLSKTDKEKRNNCLRMIANFQKDLFTAKYSIGASREELRQLFIVYLDTLMEIKTNEYAEYADAIAIARLLDIDMTRIGKIRETDDLSDGLTATIMKYPDVSKEALRYPNYYQPFYDYITGKTGKDAFVNYMSSSWYPSSEEFAWYDSDKSKEDVYVGYWCWLAAACLKLRNEETDSDASFIPCAFIP